MLKPSTIVIYVDDLEKSITFYQSILTIPCERHSTSFASFTFSNDISIGLKDKTTVHPRPDRPVGGEIAFTLDTTDEVDRLYLEWKKRGIPIPEEPVKLNFAYTFIAIDPDKYRIRVACMRD
jgi:predicted enzyme related to lactoylglutathione lyase